MIKVVATVQSFALTLGAPGLFLVALLDSSVLSLPQVPDLLLIWMVTKHPSYWLLYALMATAGSIVGCTADVPAGAQGRRARAAQDGQCRADGARPRDVPEVGPARGAGALDPATAGALQGVRPARGCRADSRCGSSWRPSALGAGSATSARRCWPVVRRGGDDVPARRTCGRSRSAFRPCSSSVPLPGCCCGSVGRSMSVRYNPAFS